MKKHLFSAKPRPEYTNHGNSDIKSEILDYVRSLDVEASSSREVISPKELDVYIPSHNLAIDYNEIYSHSAWSKADELALKPYHISKTTECIHKCVQLLHIFENEWLDKQDIWKSIIRTKLGKSDQISCQNCDVRDISTKLANDFCERNHLQGKCVASKALGLFYNDELVQVITIGKPRYSKKCDFEIIRTATKLNTVITGGISKLLAQCPTGSYMSYVNRRWSDGNEYQQAGFNFLNLTGPCYWVVDGKTLYHRSAFMKHKLKDKLEFFDPDLTEAENCYANGLGRIWDCGSESYELVIS